MEQGFAQMLIVRKDINYGQRRINTIIKRQSNY